MSNSSQRKGYKYIRCNSIVNPLSNEYELSTYEYYKLYAFFVTYSMCGRQSLRRRSILDYGWEKPTFKDSGLLGELEKVLCLNSNNNFSFCKEHSELRDAFKKCSLEDGEFVNVDIERAVIAPTGGNNKYEKLFYRIRDGLAHGSFSLKINSHGQKMIVFQDQDSSNVTARIVMRLDTLLRFVRIVDRNHLIVRANETEGMEVA